MGILSAFQSSPKTEKREYNPEWLKTLNSTFSLSNLSAPTGVTVPNEHTALTATSVWSAMKLLSEIPASLDIQHRVLNGDYFKNVTDTPIARILRKPNSFQTRFQFFQSMLFRMNLRGNSYALRRMDSYGKIELIPINDSVDVSVSPKGDELFYTVNGVTFPQD